MYTDSVQQRSSKLIDRLPPRQLRSVLSVLDACAGISAPAQFRDTVVHAISDAFGIRDVTFFVGASFDGAFADPNPTLTGATAPLLNEYQARWQDKDIFATAHARRLLSRDGFMQLSDYPRLPAPQRSYVVDYLAPHGMTDAYALHLQTRHGHALIGMFDERRRLEGSEVLAARVLAKQLRAHAAHVSFNGDTEQSTLDKLSPRQREVATLISEGHSNMEIATLMSVTEQSVKKYTSRIFAATGCANRAALTARILRESA